MASVADVALLVDRGGELGLEARDLGARASGTRPAAFARQRGSAGFCCRQARTAAAHLPASSVDAGHELGAALLDGALAGVERLAVRAETGAGAAGGRRGAGQDRRRPSRPPSPRSSRARGVSRATSRSATQACCAVTQAATSSASASVGTPTLGAELDLGAVAESRRAEQLVARQRIAAREDAPPAPCRRRLRAWRGSSDSRAGLGEAARRRRVSSARRSTTARRSVCSVFRCARRILAPTFCRVAAHLATSLPRASGRRRRCRRRRCVPDSPRRRDRPRRRRRRRCSCRSARGRWACRRSRSRRNRRGRWRCRRRRCRSSRSPTPRSKAPTVADGGAVVVAVGGAGVAALIERLAGRRRCRRRRRDSSAASAWVRVGPPLSASGSEQRIDARPIARDRRARRSRRCSGCRPRRRTGRCRSATAQFAGVPGGTTLPAKSVFSSVVARPSSKKPPPRPASLSAIVTFRITSTSSLSMPPPSRRARLPLSVRVDERDGAFALDAAAVALVRRRTERGVAAHRRALERGERVVGDAAAGVEPAALASVRRCR